MSLNLSLSSAVEQKPEKSETKWKIIMSCSVLINESPSVCWLSAGARVCMSEAFVSCRVYKLQQVGSLVWLQPRSNPVSQPHARVQTTKQKIDKNPDTDGGRYFNSFEHFFLVNVLHMTCKHFNTALYSTVMRWKISKNYLRSWFAPALCRSNGRGEIYSILTIKQMINETGQKIAFHQSSRSARRWSRVMRHQMENSRRF